MKTRQVPDASYPYRLDLYRRDRFGTPQGKKPIVVVHGYWDKRYPLQWFMHMLADQLPDHAVYEYSFETPGGIKPTSVSLELVARDLGHELLRTIREDALGQGVVFIGHSTGGLVARRCFVDNSHQLAPGSFVFLACPHYGAATAEFKNWLARTLFIRWGVREDRQTLELAPGSDFIWRLTRDWSNVLRNWPHPERPAIDRVLSVVGTTSDQAGSRLWRLPKGRWVQSDGVVRTTSAFLSPHASQMFMGLNVPLGHVALYDVAQAWRNQESIKHGWPEQPPEPVRDMTFAATIQFLRGKSPQSHSELWQRIGDYFEELERNWHQGRRQRGEEMRDPAMEMYVQQFDGVEGPHFVNRFREYCGEAKSYWNQTQKGAALIRLDYVDIPPRPSVANVTDLDGRPIHSRAAKASVVRHGSRWATLYLPELDEGTYRVVWQHGKRSYEADFSVAKHFTTAVEINGFNAKTSILSGDPSKVSVDVSQAFDALDQQIKSRDWQAIYQEF